MCRPYAGQQTWATGRYTSKRQVPGSRFYIHGGFPSLVTELRRRELSTWQWSWEAEFAAHTRFVCYDRRGCYRSSVPPEGYDLCTQAADIGRVLDVLCIDSAHLIGSSAGGPIALLFAATSPHRVRSLVLVGTTLELFPREDAATRQITACNIALRKRGRSALVDCRPSKAVASFDALWEEAERTQRGELMGYREVQAEIDRRASHTSEAVRQFFYEIELKAIQAYMNMDLRPYARSVHCPGIVVHGTADRMIPIRCGRELVELLDGFLFIPIENGPHGLAIRSAEGRKCMIDFIQSLSVNAK